MKSCKKINNPKGLKLDYAKIHNKFIKHFKSTSPRDRLKQRTPEDPRNFSEYLYTELHHIVPKSLGGKNSPENLVRLLPEEHIFIHMLLYKAYNRREDLLAFRFCLNGIREGSKKLELSKNSIHLSKDVRQGYSLLKQYSAEFRKKHGWQTPEGLKRISESRKGKIPVIDAVTGESKGSVTKDHPKYKSGEWVHHTKGALTVFLKGTETKVRITSKEYQSNKEKYELVFKTAGEKNGRYSGITDEEILNNAKIFYEKMRYLPSWKKLGDFCKENNLKYIIGFSNFRFDGRGVCGFYEEVEKLLGVKYPRDCKGKISAGLAAKTKVRNQYGEFDVKNKKNN